MESKFEINLTCEEQMIVFRQKFSLIFWLLLFSVSLAVGQTQQAQSPSVRAAAYLDEQWRMSGAPGISVAVAYKGRIVFSKGIGFIDIDNNVPATSSSVYNIGSVSKVVTAVGVMKLIEQGKIKLDDSISQYVSEFPDKGTPITIRQIMTHTTGIRHYRRTDFPDSIDNENWKPYSSFADAIKLFKEDPLLFKPGEYYFYSSYAVNLLQGLVEKVSGMSFEDYMRKNVWIPAAMINTSFDVPERIVPNRAKGYMQDKGRLVNNPYGDLTYKFASGGMISTVEDMVRFGVALNHGGLLKPETIALMYQPQIKDVFRFQTSGNPSNLEFEMGLMWNMRKDNNGRIFIYHCGTVKGFNACFVNYPEEDLVVATADNMSAIGFRPGLEFADFFRNK